MYRVPLVDKVVEGLEIDEHIGCTEGQKAHMLRCCRMQQRTGAKMEGCDRHMALMRSNLIYIAKCQLNMKSCEITCKSESAESRMIRRVQIGILYVCTVTIEPTNYATGFGFYAPAEQVRKRFRYMHYSMQTGKAYIYWIR